ncbi:MAG: hypothetical protein JWN42_2366 [Candidatus Angelobacter sp.]|nr:hypothetical protein [Candidatus Angelobacter sp.]
MIQGQDRYGGEKHVAANSDNKRAFGFWIPRYRSGWGSSRFPLFQLLHFLFHVLDLNAVFADIEAQVGVNTHVLVGDPDQREAADQVAAPIVKQKLVVSDEKEKRRHVMAEAELAGKEEIKLAAPGVGMVHTLADAILPRLAENILVRYRPGDAGDGQRERKQPYELQRERHL